MSLSVVLVMFQGEVIAKLTASNSDTDISINIVCLVKIYHRNLNDYTYYVAKVAIN